MDIPSELARLLWLNANAQYQFARQYGCGILSGIKGTRTNVRYGGRESVVYRVTKCREDELISDLLVLDGVTGDEATTLGLGTLRIYADANAATQYVNTFSYAESVQTPRNSVP